MNYALCCISNQLAREGYKFQKMTYTRFKSLDKNEAIKILSERILNNFVVTHKVLEHCVKMGLEGYRLSSDLTPVLNHPDVNIRLQDLPNYDTIYSVIRETISYYKRTGIRITAHPSEFISLTSKDPNVIKNSIRDLVSHGEIFDLYELPRSYDACLNIHCRQEGDPEEVSKTFLSNYNKLPETVKSRLTLEVNDNKNGIWTVKNLCKYFYNEAGIPITFDTLHHAHCNSGESDYEAFNLAYKTWPVIPVFHYSEGINGSRNHAETALGLPNGYDKPVLWDIELKGKDDAIALMLSRHK